MAGESAADRALVSMVSGYLGKPTHSRSSYSPLLFETAAVEQDDIDDTTFETVWLRARKPSLFRAFLNEFVKKHVQCVTANGWPVDATTVAAGVKAIVAEIRSGASSTASPSWIFISLTETLPPDEVVNEVSSHFPGTVNIHCVTTCLGSTTDTGFKSTHCDDGTLRALSLMAVYDPLGSFATIGVPAPNLAPPKDFNDIMDSAYMELRAAAPDMLKDPNNEGNPYPAPEPLAENMNIWMTGLPGMEERILEALYDWGHMRFSRTIRVMGGTGADSTIAGKWLCYGQQVDGRRVTFGQDDGPGVVFTLISASVKVFPCFMHPFTPVTECTARVMSCGSTEERRGEAVGRVMHTFKDPDGLEVAAGTLYHKWCEDLQKKMMPPPTVAGGPDSFNPAVLGAAPYCPLGVPVAREGDDAYDYRMICPTALYRFKDQEHQEAGDSYIKSWASVEAGKSDVVFFKARRGDLLHRLAKLKEQLVQQIDRSSGSSAESVALSPDALRARVSGVLMVYCCGCMVALNSGKDAAEQMRRLTVSLSNCFAGRPFLAFHGLGEQGFFASKQVNHHSNLMFSALVFSKDPCFEVDESRSFTEMIAPILRRFSASEGNNLASAVLQSMLARGAEANFNDLALITRANMITPALLQEITPCASKPLAFALRSAHMFHTMAKKYPLKARDYRKAEAWFKKFCQDFMEAAPMFLLARGNVLDYPTIGLSVMMAMQIDCKGLVASTPFQEVMDEVWTVCADPEEAIRKLLADEVGAERGIWRCSPRTRHYANMASYIFLTCLQAYTSGYDTSSRYLWGCIFVWSLSNMLQTLASPVVGFYSYATMMDDVVLVFSHAYILSKVGWGGEVPRDLDALTMILHFGNILKQLVVQPRLGPLIIMVTTMMGDIQQFLVLFAFFLTCFTTSFSALYREVTSNMVGEDWTSPAGLLVNIVWGPQLLWSSDPSHSGSTLWLSAVLGVRDSTAIDIMGSLIIATSVLLIPVLLLNLLIAMMAASYNDVSANVDAEYKRSFASCVLVARELSILPMPLSLPMDLMRCLAKVKGKCRAWAYPAGPAGKHEAQGQEQNAREQLAVSQLVALWEARVSIEKFKASVTMDQVERMRSQGDGLQDRSNLIYNSILNLTEKVDRMEMRMVTSVTQTVERRVTERSTTAEGHGKPGRR